MKMMIFAAAFAVIAAGDAFAADQQADQEKSCERASLRVAAAALDHRAAMAEADAKASGRSARHGLEAYAGLARAARELRWDIRRLERTCPGSVIVVDGDDENAGVRKTANANGAR